MQIILLRIKRIGIKKLKSGICVGIAVCYPLIF